MKYRVVRFIILLLILNIVALTVPSCNPREVAESYVAVVPKVLHSSSREAISITLLKGQNLISGRVEVALSRDGKEVVRVRERIKGKGRIEIDIPDVEEGKYELQIKGNGFEDKAEVRVEKSFLIFAETDKPIYKPGQTMHLRIITLDAELKPVSEPATVEIMDAKGIKLFRNEIDTDEFGMVTFDFPIESNSQ